MHKHPIRFALKLGVLCLAFSLAIVQAQITPAIPDDASAEPEEVENILKAMEQNSRKVTNLRGYFVTVSVADPDFTNPQTASPPPSTDSKLVRGKMAYINKSLVAYRNGKTFVNTLITRAVPGDSFWHYEKEWFDGKTTYWLQELPNQKPIAQPRPFPIMGLPEELQIQPISERRPPSRATLLKRYHARVVGKEQFNGLSCLRLEYSYASQKTPESVRGFTLVCPERDYKEVYREHHLMTSDPQSPIKEVVTKRIVSEFKRYGDVWLPSATRLDWHDTFANGQSRLTRTEEFRVAELSIGTINDDSIFVPAWSPDTTINRPNEKAVVAGSDTTEIQYSLQRGAFSDIETWRLKVEDKPTSKAQSAVHLHHERNQTQPKSK